MLSKLLIIILLIWGFFNPPLASWVFIGFLAFYELLVFGRYQAGKDIKIDKLNDYENEIARKFNLPVRYPFVSVSQNKTLVLAGALSLAWIVLLIFNKLYIQAAIIFLNIYFANYLARLLNPSYFGNRHKNDSGANMDYEDFMDIMAKLYPEWSGKIQQQKSHK